MIYIVGAGSYPMDLLTVAALKLIKKADCILYDHLIDHHILSMVKPECELIDVGKQGHGKTTSQSYINTILIEKGRQYDVVVRLKGGDPGIFGRGGEEMIRLKDQGFAIQWIPGISAINALGYAGIPLTHRDLSSGFSVDTLHYKDGSNHIDFDRIVHDKRTQVFFMGSDRIDVFVDGCLKAGIDPKTTITFASRLTYPDQYVVSTSFDLVNTMDRSHLVSPLLIIIGSCGKLHDRLDPNRVLKAYGKKVVFLSLKPFSWPIDTLWLDHGIFAYEIQVGQIKPLVPPLPNIDGFTMMVFVSTHAVEYFFNAMTQLDQDIRRLYGHPIIAIGEKTSQCLHAHGLIVDHVFSCRATLNASGLDHQQPWLWIGSDRSEPSEASDFHYICYQLEPIAFDMDYDIDAIGVSCPFSIERLAQYTNERTIPLYCFNHRSYQTALSYGFTNIICCDGSKYSLVSTMVNDLEETA